MTKTPDEIMAVHLLNGGKMLSEMCPECGAPLFEKEGRKICVVCAERQTEENEAGKTAAPAAAGNAPVIRAEAVHKEDSSRIAVITPSYAKGEQSGFASPDLDDLIASLTARAKAETDPGRCLTLIECIRTAAEAKTILARLS
ncbi:MAG: autoantigen p27 domain-containing protein [Methanocorpusculum sp.]|nr:autoantigen p27 domain-containing protein [Methanocorpusculum sp.]